MERSAQPRSAALDTLRGIALLLVLFYHMPLTDKLPSLLYGSLLFWQRGGWVGIDLFFVLTGFFTAGLLFREYRREGEFRVGHFLARREWRLLPPFYIMLAVVFGWAAYKGHFPGWNYVTSEALLHQNYGLLYFPHTWSLAIAQHFFLGLPMVLWLFRGRRSTPFPWMPYLIATIAVSVLALRFMERDGIAQQNPEPFRAVYTATHLRCDALFFGVLIAWLYHFRRQTFDALARRSWLLLGSGLVLLSPAFIFGLQAYVPLLTIGFTCLYIGAGALLIAFLHRDWSFRPVATLGHYSYSIFLWHIPFRDLVIPYLLLPDPQTKKQFAFAADLVGPRPEPAVILAAYFILAIFGGIVMAWLVEIPFLRWRERATR